MKTIDKKNAYKVADLSQIMVCSHELGPTPTEQPDLKPGGKKEMKQWQYPHGLTPPMKSARRRRFRKTKKKKYMDAPEVEKELKRLLRADLEADSIRWEIVPADDKKKVRYFNLRIYFIEISVDAQLVTDTTLFGDKVSSSDDEDEVTTVKEEDKDA
uniref:TAFII55_N domain-containing protein n=1 Tax=Heterorhabditis bacteriophora TaxID=37862 RepID=A0A1I7XQL0_HETBA